MSVPNVGNYGRRGCSIDASFWYKEDKLLQSVQEVQHKNTHIYPLNMDDKIIQISIQGAQRLFSPSHIYFFGIVQ